MRENEIWTNESWQQQFRAKFLYNQPINYLEIETFITELLAQEKSQMLREIIGEERKECEIHDSVVECMVKKCGEWNDTNVGFNQHRQEILDRAKNLGITLTPEELDNK